MQGLGHSPPVALPGGWSRAGVFDRTLFLGRRDEMGLRLLLYTGVRVSELCGRGLTHVDLDRELAYVTGAQVLLRSVCKGGGRFKLSAGERIRLSTRF